ncbi:MAG: efflux RND transporter periplasmic adaptor subunit [Bacteroidales bacterium]|nr:efflux RND transporter periplasmic adaptor subunit [Bacteroidales bacterium]
MKKLLIISIILGLLSCAQHESHEHNHEHEGHVHTSECGHEHHHDADEHHHNHEEVVSNTVAFSHEQMEKVDFEVMKVENKAICQIIKTTARVLPSQNDVRIITAATDGIVEFAKDNLVEGLDLQNGMTILTINNGKMAQGNLSVLQEEITADYNRAKANYERKKSLFADRLVTENDLQEAEAEYLKAKKAYDNMQENFADGRQVVKSPVPGYVKDIFVENGSYVTAGQELMTICRAGRLYLKADLQPKYFPVLKNVVSANFKSLNSNKVYSLEDLNGRLLSYGKATSFDNPLIPVTFEIDDNDELVSGSFVELYIITKDENEGIMIPNSALIEEMGSYFVFVEVRHELFEKRAVTVELSDGFNTQIVRGLEPDETVVSKGAIYIKLAQGSGKLDPHAGHVH